MDHTADFYSRPSHEFRGGGFQVFTGSRRQRGGGIFGSLKNFFLPVAKHLGKKLLSHGVGLARDVAQDAMEGRSIKDSLINRGKARAIDFGKNTAREGIGALSNMVGRGSRRVRRRRKTKSKRKVSRRRKTKRTPRSTSRKPASRKRRMRSKSAPKRKAKRRRIAANF